MDITRQMRGNVLVLQATGRLDANWSAHLGNEIADALRGGAREIELNLKAVSYISSAGIRVLLQSHKQLKAIAGSFIVSEPSSAVRNVLELAGVAEIFVVDPGGATDVGAAPNLHDRELTHGQATFRVLSADSGAAFCAKLIGDPILLTGCRYRREHCREMAFTDSMLGVGLGAFGRDFDDSQGRFGEFIAAAGGAAYLPTDGSKVPDYSIAEGQLLPRLQVLYGIACEGKFSHVVQFEKEDDAHSITLHEIVEASQEIAGEEKIALAMIAESAGLMGAALLRSPVLTAAGDAPFHHPEIREWLSFTSEKAFSRSLSLVVGVAAPATGQDFGSLLRPLGKHTAAAGHFHAGAFSYRPLKRGETNFVHATRDLFETETLQGMLHLINDERQIAGGGESEFLRGTCWIGPISQISEDGN